MNSISFTSLPVRRLLIALFAFATAVSLPASIVMFEIGTFNGNFGEFEQEGANRNNAQFYVDAGNYSTVLGKSVWNAGNGAGYGAMIAEAEPLQAGSRWAGDSAPVGSDPTNTLGFPRSLTSLSGGNTNNRNVIDIFFQATTAEVAEGSLLFETAFISLGTGSSHNIEFYLNGDLFGSISNMTSAQSYSITFAATALNAGSNVLSLVKTDAFTATGEPWVGIDAIRLTAIPENSSVTFTFGAFVTLAMIAKRMSRRQRQG
ncbi:hypothetical protein [Geminisphaera colitermitum]|uniref:hypothetical protein n=1 Tax=Geminisphaera colitermitum TaxID=1148786 RepID=UPI0001964DCD|nr:hypothetical protein [Geminisphaera colitermitum]